MVSAIILAAGQSKRMKGDDKLFLKINGKAMYEYALNLAKEIDVNNVIVVTNNDKIALRALECGFCSVKSQNAHNGMGNSVCEGAKALSDKTKYAIFLNADQPFLKPNIVNEIIKICVQHDKIVVPMSNNMPTSPCIFTKKYFDDLKSLNGENGGRVIWKRHLKDVIFYSVDSGQFLDIDTKEQYDNIK